MHDEERVQGPERPGGGAAWSGGAGPERPGGGAAWSGGAGPERPGGGAAWSGGAGPERPGGGAAWSGDPAAPASVTTALAGTRFEEVRFLPEVDSTMRYVRDAAAAGARHGLVAVADFQHAGRGRRGRAWEAPPGTALLMSILLDAAGLPPTRLHLVTAAVALSARDACAEVGGFSPDLKWPNDLLVGERKLAGILAESSGSDVVVGLGVNLSSAPPGAVSANEVAGGPVAHDRLLVAILRGLDGWWGRWEAVATAYRQACATVGRRVRVEQAGGDIEGLAERIDEDGRLLVRSGSELVPVAAGDVVHLRAVDPR